MGHKPDQRARKRRRDREALKSAQPGRPTLHGLMKAKREAIRKNRTDLREQMKRAPAEAVREYRRSQREIRKLLRDRQGLTPVMAELYPAARRGEPLPDGSVRWVWTLLTHPANGWDVVLGRSLAASGGITLTFRFDSTAD